VAFSNDNIIGFIFSTSENRSDAFKMAPTTSSSNFGDLAARFKSHEAPTFSPRCRMGESHPVLASRTLRGNAQSF
jgi:hypothetical protein